MKKTTSLLVVLLAMTSMSFAGTAVSSKKVVVSPDNDLFRANEWQLDASVEGTAGTFRGKTRGSLGGDLGINYFFTKYIGLGLDNAVSGAGSPGPMKGTDRQMFDLLFRYPIETWHLAPYSMVGGGASWDSSTQGYFNIGAGFEYRLTQHVGLFSDCRWIYGNNGTHSQGLVSKAYPRIGVRFIF